MGLRYLRIDSADILKSFNCGIHNMDIFIHSSLDSLIQQNKKYSLFIVEDDEVIVGMYVISTGHLVDSDGVFHEIPEGEPWIYLGKELQVQDAQRYETQEIDYLAVREDLLKTGIGTAIIRKLSQDAMEKGYYFLTVDAYHDSQYSAIPFYEKMGFFALEEYSEEKNTLRMAKVLA